MGGGDRGGRSNAYHAGCAGRREDNEDLSVSNSSSAGTLKRYSRKGGLSLLGVSSYEAEGILLGPSELGVATAYPRSEGSSKGGRFLAESKGDA